VHLVANVSRTTSARRALRELRILRATQNHARISLHHCRYPMPVPRGPAHTYHSALSTQTHLYRCAFTLRYYCSHASHHLPIHLLACLAIYPRRWPYLAYPGSQRLSLGVSTKYSASRFWRTYSLGGTYTRLHCPPCLVLSTTLPSSYRITPTRLRCHGPPACLNSLPAQNNGGRTLTCAAVLAVTPVSAT